MELKGIRMGSMLAKRNFQADLPSSHIASTIDSVIIQGGDKSVIKFMKTVLCYNVFLVTSPAQPHGTRDSEISTIESLTCNSRYWFAFVAFGINTSAFIVS